jgi:hypothetical protein
MSLYIKDRYWERSVKVKSALSAIAEEKCSELSEISHELMAKFSAYVELSEIVKVKVPPGICPPG